MATTSTDALDDFSTEVFSHEGKQRTIYRAGDGPAVIVMAEMPGITPAVAAFARRVVDAGCSVWMPDLFGRAGEPASPVAYARSLGPACVAREFAAFASGTTAPVIDWLRALARHAHATCGGPGVGAVGMCWTGGFALGMMADDVLMAPVLSQPSLPLVPPWRKGNAADPGVSEADMARVEQRTAEGVCVLGLRFTGDKLSPADRFATLRDRLGDAFIGVEIDSSPGNPWGFGKKAHSVLTEELVDEPGHPTREALDQVLGFLTERLEVG
ncbi:MAG: dienelactone hydrolase family protein [Acidimicrobiia bacterium]|nr:dienelactone hydrolase family protein [Acidimicrobiia bacterium]